MGKEFIRGTLVKDEGEGVRLGRERQEGEPGGRVLGYSCMSSSAKAMARSGVSHSLKESCVSRDWACLSLPSLLSHWLGAACGSMVSK